MRSFWDALQCVWIDVIVEKHTDNTNYILKVCKRNEEGGEACVTGFIYCEDMEKLVKYLEEAVQRNSNM